MAKFYKQSEEVRKKEVEAARERAERGGGDGRREYVWGNLQPGNNTLRILPPYNARGFKGRIITMYSFLPISPDRPPVEGAFGKARHLPFSYPDRQDCPDPIGDVFRKYEKQNRDLVYKWRQLRSKAYANAIDRNDPNQQVKIYGLPIGTWNWFQLQEDANNMDFTDPHEGIDISIVKSGAGMKTTYSPNTDPRGCSAITADEEALDRIAEEIYDLDEVFAYPSDEKLAEQYKLATILDAFLLRQLGKAKPKTKSELDGKPSTQPSPQPSPQPSTGTPTPPTSLAEARDVSRPTCYGGGEHTADNTTQEDIDDTSNPILGMFGHQEGHHKCLVCPLEIGCEDGD